MDCYITIAKKESKNGRVYLQSTVETPIVRMPIFDTSVALALSNLTAEEINKAPLGVVKVFAVQEINQKGGKSE